MKKILALFAVLLLGSFTVFAQKTVSVLQFETDNADIKDKMGIVTNIFKSELSSAPGIRLVDRANVSKNINELNFQKNGLTSEENVKSLGNMLNADYIVIGQVDVLTGDDKIIEEWVTHSEEKYAGLLGAITGKTQNRTFIVKETKTEKNRKIVIAAQMISVDTSEVIATSSASVDDWPEISIYKKEIVKPLIDSLIVSSTFSKVSKDSLAGSWTGEVVHDGITDTYILTFSGKSTVLVEIESRKRGGETKTYSKKCRYSYDQFFNLNADMQDSSIKHLKSLNWRTTIDLSESDGRITMIIPVASNSSVKNRVDFYQDED